MRDATNFVKIIKSMAVDANEVSKPCNVVFGVVTSTAPLEILVEQKMTLGEAQLVLMRNVTDFFVDVTVEWESEIVEVADYMAGTTSMDGSPEHTHEFDQVEGEHSHDILGKKTMKIHSSLVVGEVVVMLRLQGGQKFLVLDRVVGV